MCETKYIASVSFGKDSLAMLLLLIEKRFPLDEVIFYDTGMEFQAIYNTRDRILPLLHNHGIQYTELHPPRPFVFDMFDKEQPSRRSPWPSTAASIATRPTISILSRGARLPNSSRSTSPKASASQSSEAYRPDPGKITTAANIRPSKSSPILSILRTPKRKAPPEATPKAL